MSTTVMQLIQKRKKRVQKENEEKLKKLVQNNMQDLKKMLKENIKKRKELKKKKDYYRGKWENYKLKILKEEHKAKDIRSAIKYKKD